MASPVCHEGELSVWQIEIVSSRVRSLVKAFQDNDELGALELLEKRGDQRADGVALQFLQVRQ